MGYKIDSDILFGLIHSELKTVLSPLNSLISDDRICHFEIAIGGIIKKAGELTDAEANSSEKPNDSDTISRRATIDEVQAIEHLGNLRDGDVVVRMNDVEHILYTMPSAQPKAGKWIKPTGMMPPEYTGVYRCSECGEIAMRDWKNFHHQTLTNYCPNCGAMMQMVSHCCGMEEKRNDRN